MSILGRRGQTGPDPDRQANMDRETEERQDRKAGRRDGKRGIPSVGQLEEQRRDDPGAKPDTPYITMLWLRAREEMAPEHEEFQKDVGQARVELAKARAEEAAAKEAAAVAAHQLEQAKVAASKPLTPEDLAPRNPAEQALPEAARKVQREHERKQWVADDFLRLQRAQSKVTVLAAQQHHWDEVITARRRVARARVEAICARTAARVAAYWGGLTDTHQDGRGLSLFPMNELRLPDWVIDDGPPAGPTSGTGGSA